VAAKLEIILIDFAVTCCGCGFGWLVCW